MEDGNAAESGEPAQNIVGVQLEIHADPTVSYASYQNNVSLLRSLNITNSTEEPLHDVEIAVRCEPEFADTMRLKFERLDPNETRRVDALDLKFQHRYLAELNEAERGRIVVHVHAAGAELAHADHRVDLLAYDQWAGTRALRKHPEIE